MDAVLGLSIIHVGTISIVTEQTIRPAIPPRSGMRSLSLRGAPNGHAGRDRTPRML
jgi:hypothetical protein